MSRYVISLGGNALGNNAEEQKELLKEVAKPIVDLIANWNEVIIIHGNGPQVGMINLMRMFLICHSQNVAQCQKDISDITSKTRLIID